MSRTIKYSIENDEEFTINQLRRLFNISSFHSASFQWVRTPFWLGPGKAEPNMKRFQNEEFAWDTMEKYISEKMSQDKHFIDVIIEGSEEGILILYDNMHSKVYYGATQVVGNEMQARQVLKALSEVSLVFPKAVIKVQDEGHLLYTDLIIRQGLAIPDTAWVSKLINDLIELAIVKNNITKPNVVFNDLTLLRYYHLDKLQRINGLEAMFQKIKNKTSINISDYESLSNIPLKDWPEVEFFMRNVTLKAFDNYVLGPETIMGGYFGEHWNLMDVDVEQESYIVLKDMQNSIKSIDINGKISIF